MEQHQFVCLFGLCFLATGRRTRTPSESSSDESVAGDPDAASSGLGGVRPPKTPPAWPASEDEFDGNDKCKAAGIWADSDGSASPVGKGRGAGCLRPNAKVRATPRRVFPPRAGQGPAVKLHPRPPVRPPPAAKQQRVVAHVAPPPPPPPLEVGSMDLPIGCRICNECGQSAYWRKGQCFNEECILYKGTGRWG
jgi:hypothetical protein